MSRETYPAPGVTTPIQTRTRRRSLVFLDGLAVVVGAGIFSSPSVVSSHVDSPSAAILVWLLAGLLVCCGASTIAQLGSAMPNDGGIQEYLLRCYGDFPAFIFVWIWVFLAKPCANAMASFVFAEHFCKLVWDVEDADRGWTNTAIALFGLVLITLINCRGATSGARVANIFLALKLSTLVSIIVSGLFLVRFYQWRSSYQGREHMFSSQAEIDTIIADNLKDQPSNITRLQAGEFTSAVFGALFACGGWDNVGFLAGELENTSQNLPRIINTAMIISISCFILMNATLYAVLPIDVLRSTNKVAVVFGAKVFGKIGADVYSILVMISCLGSINASTFAIGRLMYRAGKHSYLPRVLGTPLKETNFHRWLASTSYRWPRLSATRPHVLWRLCRSSGPAEGAINPVYAMVFNASITGIYILLASFRGLVTFKGISEYSVYALTCFGSLLLPENSADAASSPLLGYGAPTEPSRTYRTYVANPIIFTLVSVALVIRGILSEPWIGLGLVSIVVVGRVVYVWKKSHVVERSQ
ncbi:amino acid permease-domain-containing protein [Rostrohypoxylon terebratum]|nr:amino acid permease-domain-containing protein [Rostrohypoxylon terebratum]